VEKIKGSEGPTEARSTPNYGSKLLINDRDKAECEIVRLEQHSCGVISLAPHDHHDSVTVKTTKTSPHFQEGVRVQEGPCPTVRPVGEVCRPCGEVAGT
jgi:hypothetical protein